MGIIASVNGFKSNLLEEEFFALIEDVYLTMKIRRP